MSSNIQPFLGSTWKGLWPCYDKFHLKFIGELGVWVEARKHLILCEPDFTRGNILTGVEIGNVFSLSSALE